MADKIKILLVDDEDTLRKLMRDELIVQGFDVKDADSGQAALDVLKNGRQDVVILDILMEGMDGLEVLKHIRKDNLADKVIMLTGVDEMKIARESVELGANDFMTKPFQFQHLFACINRVMKES